MRSAVAFVALAACYTPPALDASDPCALACAPVAPRCPDDRTCTAGYCLLAGQATCDPQASPDARTAGDDGRPQPDGPPLARACTPAVFVGDGAPLPNELDDHTAAAGVTAWKGAQGVYTTHDLANPALGTAQLHPRLGPDGDELFVTSSVTHRLYRSTWSGTAWTTPAELSTVASWGDPTPGTVSATSPRRMVIASQSGLEELAETNNVWSSVQSLAFSGLQTPAYPSLSRDGTRLLFTATDGTGELQVWAATRTTPTETFSAPISIYQGDASSPWLADDDCGTLYVTLPGGVSAIALTR